jgi:hypothetical protein
MSKKQGEASRGAQPPPGSPSVYDFLYQDVRRVGSLLAQFHPEGLLQSTKRTESVQDSYGSNENQTGAVNVGVVKGAISTTETVAQASLNSAERAYDPLWQNSIALLTFLQNQSYLQRSLEAARIGQTVLISGELEVFDTSFFLKAFSDPHNTKQATQILTGSTPQTPKARAEEKATLDKISAGVKLLSRFPLEVQALLQTSKSSVWCVLKSACLETTPTNLFLEFGSTVPGEWSILGILDSFPDSETSSRVVDVDREGDTIFAVMRKLDRLSGHLGRPSSAYGVTPILIFRRVEAA